MFFDDFETVDEYCGFEPSDRDAWEEQQVFLDDEGRFEVEENFDDPRDEDWAMDQEELWADAEADGFFADGFHDFE